MAEFARDIAGVEEKTERMKWAEDPSWRRRYLGVAEGAELSFKDYISFGGATFAVPGAEGLILNSGNSPR